VKRPLLYLQLLQPWLQLPAPSLWWSRQWAMAVATTQAASGGVRRAIFAIALR
jgi:hypothetical protein